MEDTTLLAVYAHIRSNMVSMLMSRKNDQIERWDITFVVHSSNLTDVILDWLSTNSIAIDCDKTSARQRPLRPHTICSCVRDDMQRPQTGWQRRRMREQMYVVTEERQTTQAGWQLQTTERLMEEMAELELAQCCG
jgi:hypothetical protein